RLNARRCPLAQPVTTRSRRWARTRSVLRKRIRWPARSRNDQPSRLPVLPPRLRIVTYSLRLLRPWTLPFRATIRKSALALEPPPPPPEPLQPPVSQRWISTFTSSAHPGSG